MSKEDIEVDLDALLGDESGSGEVATPGASDQETTVATTADTTTKTAEEIEQEKAEASQRAQDRIRELAEENARKDAEIAELKGKKSPTDFQDVETFLNAIEDEPSKNLLQKYTVLLEKKFAGTISPVMTKVHEATFEEQFSPFAAKAPALAAYKEDLKKSYLSNPNQSVKALIGEAIVDGVMSKVKPIEGAGGTANRSQPDISTASKEDLYSILEGMK